MLKYRIRCHCRSDLNSELGKPNAEKWYQFCGYWLSGLYRLRLITNNQKRLAPNRASFAQLGGLRGQPWKMR